MPPAAPPLIAERKPKPEKRLGANVYENTRSEQGWKRFLFLRLTRRVYVRRQVFGQVVCACETLAAHVAVIGPFSRMNAQMPGQVAFTTKRSSAKQTYERTLPRMLPHVQFQIFLRSHAPKTHNHKMSDPATLTLISNILSAERTSKTTLPLAVRGVTNFTAQ